MTAIEQLAGRAPDGELLDPVDDLEALVDESRRHPALSHPWLRRFAAASFPDMAAAMRDFAWNYYGYSAWFPRYLEAVISRLPDPAHRELLRHNLEEESGKLEEDGLAAIAAMGIDPSTVDGVPHPELFRRFCRALGLGDTELRRPGPVALSWRSRFRRFLRQATPAQAVGALGLGTEGIVRPVYEQILRGIRATGMLSRPDYVFFELHCEVDDQHQKDLLAIARDLAVTPGALAELREGMLVALRLRCEVWDALGSRAAVALQVRSA